MMTAEERTTAKLLWRQGLNDRQIAERLGLKQANVTYWRRKMGLPSHRRYYGRRAKPGNKCTHDNCFTCPYRDCIHRGPFPYDQVYNEMIAAGGNTVPEKKRLKDYDEPK